MIGLGLLYAVGGLMFAAFAVLSLVRRPRRAGNVLFCTLIAASFLFSDRLGEVGNGVLVLAIVAVATLGRMRPRDHDAEPIGSRGAWLFVPAPIIPLTALAGTLLFGRLQGRVDPKQVTLVSLTFGVILALGVCYAWLRPPPTAPFREGTRLMGHIGWAAILPQLLVSLGAVFALAGMGDVVGSLIGHVIRSGSVFGAVAVYCIGMAALTIIMGNTFAAFPVMLPAIGLPLLIRVYHGEPARIAAIGMVAGFCGTLVTPMSANFNLVPAALLELKDRYGVIRAQVPTAITLRVVNIVLLYLVMP